MQPIEAISAGTNVWGCDEVTGEWRLAPVEDCHQRLHEGDVVTVELHGGDGFTATDEHPVWVIEGEALDSRPDVGHCPTPPASHVPGRWVRARDLRAGDGLVARITRTARVASVSCQPATVIVYNLQVEDLATYAVASCGVWVHNNSGKKGDLCPDDFSTGEPSPTSTPPRRLSPGEFEDAWRRKVNGGPEQPFAFKDVPEGEVPRTTGRDPTGVDVDVPTETHLWQMKRHEPTTTAINDRNRRQIAKTVDAARRAGRRAGVVLPRDIHPDLLQEYRALSEGLGFDIEFQSRLAQGS